MNTRRLGRTGPHTAAFGLGCMGMSDAYGPSDETESEATIHAALDAGINLIDTGDFYAMGDNEMLIGRALRRVPRDKYLLSVKFGAQRGPDGQFLGFDASPNAVKTALAYTLESEWRNRGEFLKGRDEIKAFLRRKWEKELDYRLMKELWAFDGNRISVRFEYEWHDAAEQWFRSHGNEHWEFDADGLMSRRDASINDIPIEEEARRYRG